MKLLRPFFALLLSVLLPAVAQAQVTTDPVFFTDNTPITLYFDATQGNAGLANHTGDVFIYTGVITNLSANPGDWKHVVNPSFNSPVAAEKMTRLSANRYSISFTPRTFYPGLAGSSEVVQKLAMVFRGAGGTPQGKGPAGADIFVDVSQPNANLQVAFTSPANTGLNPTVVNPGASITVAGTASAAATLTLRLNGTQVGQPVTNATSISMAVSITQPGVNTLELTATSGTTTATATTIVLLTPTPSTAALPAGAKADGVTYLAGGTSVIVSFTAPNKSYVYLVGDFNNWQPTNATLLNRTNTSSPSNINISNPAAGTDAATNRWWVRIDNLVAGREYGYQFLVDGNMRVADPYAEKILDPNNDRFIPEVTYPAAERQYPTGKTSGIVGVFQSNQTPYVWQTTNFQRPARTNMVVYELLVRDFIGRHDFPTLTARRSMQTMIGDTLDYLQRLGVNTIELMPINEFDGNESWGYNPCFYFTPDKYYGTRLAFKQFIDEAHRRGMAVVLDMVLNQSTGQSPMVQMYADASGFEPREGNPWFNATATHPFNVFSDFNHESAYTRYFSKRVMEYWLKEYKLDGYRFDLSKGFTQTRNTDTGLWSRYDQSRIEIWQDYYNTIVATDATAYPILEHFAADDEERELSNRGMMLWHNMNHNYNEATMGYVSGSNSDLSRAFYRNRGFAQPNLLTYMESHDEERLAYKNKMFGNNGPNGYNVRDQATSMARNEAAAAFFFTVPGPKMIWQFGEVGYDFSINTCSNGTTIQEDCRTASKPIRWNYYQESSRRRLYDVYRSLIALKAQPVFANASATYNQDVAGAVKTINISDASLSVTVVGNFDVQAANVNPRFQSTGTWYNYLTGVPITVTNTTATLPLRAGEYAIYTSRPIAKPAGTLLASRAAQNAARLRLSAAPNPTATTATLRYELPTASAVSVTLSNVLGATVRTISPAARQAAGPHELQVPVADLANGVYLVRLVVNGQPSVTRLAVQH